MKQISKTPSVPISINQKLCNLLTELCFDSEICASPVDLIFVFGTPFFFHQTASVITALLQKQYANKVLITGGIVPHGEPYAQWAQIDHDLTNYDITHTLS